MVRCTFPELTAMCIERCYAALQTCDSIQILAKDKPGWQLEQMLVFLGTAAGSSLPGGSLRVRKERRKPKEQTLKIQ